MNSKFALSAALLAAFASIAATAQTAPAAPPAPAAPAAPAAAAAPAPVEPQAFPAKIALIAFQQAVVATNEGQQTLEEVKKKYEPKQAQLEALNTEIENLKKQLQAAPASLTDAERAARMKKIDTDQKQLDRDTEDARTAYQADLQEAYGKVAQKVNQVLLTYVQTHGYTLLLDVGNEQSNVMWAARDPSADITEAVVNAYNVASGVAAPAPEAPSAPAAQKPAASTSHSTTPHTTTKPQ